MAIPEANERKRIHPSKENSWENESKRKKVSIKKTSVHVGKKQFKCEICNANFALKGNWKIHVDTAHREKQFKCDVCNAMFTQKGNLKTHISTVHEGRKPFKCDICDYRSSLKGTMNRHIASAHKEKKPL